MNLHNMSVLEATLVQTLLVGLTLKSLVLWFKRTLKLSLASNWSLTNTGWEGVLQWVWSVGVAITNGGREDRDEVNWVRILVISESITKKKKKKKKKFNDFFLQIYLKFHC